MRLAASLAVSAAIMAIGQIPAASAQEPYLGEIREFPYTFCPRGWTEAKGQLLPISQNTALFSLLGTNYGGDGRTTFGLPDFTPLAPPPPPPPLPVTAGVEFFGECDFGGWSALVGEGDYSKDDLPEDFENNDASSVRVAEGWEVTVYARNAMDGTSATFTADDACFEDEGLDDEVSSLSVRQITPPPPPPPRTLPKVKTCIALVGIYPSRN
ncbi:MAG: tail fiber protein [Hyphomonadaceae bacterium]|nr:tail fiber protein [Hyphomonadaceae bacterium]